jgi:hypothetical protein
MNLTEDNLKHNHIPYEVGKQVWFEDAVYIIKERVVTKLDDGRITICLILNPVNKSLKMRFSCTMTRKEFNGARAHVDFGNW